MPSPPAAQRRTTNLDRRIHLLEREAELEQIGGALRGAAAGSGAMVVIEGAAGIGKSSLMGVAAELAEAGRMTVLSARGGTLEREFALGVVIQLLAPSLESLTGRQRDRVFAGAAGLARPLFEQVPDRAAADDRLFARFHGLHWLCARLAEERPLALLVDDAHWADAHSLRFLAYLEARIDEIPACVVLVVRTGEAAVAPEALTRLIEGEPLTVIRPRPLSQAAIAELVRDSLGEETGDEVCLECARTTGGNPLLVRQLIAALDERGGERASLDAGAIAAMGPPSVARFVAARLRRRSATVSAIARALAILGDDASLADTAAVAGVARGAAANAVDSLIEVGLLFPGLPPRFVHPIVQQALQESIPPAERAQLHLVAARELTRDPGSMRARGSPPAGRRRRWARWGAMGVRRAEGVGSTGYQSRLAGTGSAVPAPGPRGASADGAAPVTPARARCGGVGRAHAGGGPEHGAGPSAVDHSNRARGSGPRPLHGAFPGR
jgi:predicted ATPase